MRLLPRDSRPAGRGYFRNRHHVERWVWVFSHSSRVVCALRHDLAAVIQFGMANSNDSADLKVFEIDFVDPKAANPNFRFSDHIKFPQCMSPLRGGCLPSPYKASSKFLRVS